MTRKRTIKLCIELWEWLIETGKRKVYWPGWEKYGKAYNNCWFCEYGMQQEKRYKSIKCCCEYCPLYSQFGSDGCFAISCGYDKWSKAKTPRTKKRYAKLFLKQIRMVK